MHAYIHVCVSDFVLCRQCLRQIWDALQCKWCHVSLAPLSLLLSYTMTMARCFCGTIIVTCLFDGLCFVANNFAKQPVARNLASRIQCCSHNLLKCRPQRCLAVECNLHDFYIVIIIFYFLFILANGISPWKLGKLLFFEAQSFTSPQDVLH